MRLFNQLVSSVLLLAMSFGHSSTIVAQEARTNDSPTALFQNPLSNLNDWRTEAVALETYTDAERDWQHLLNAAEDSVAAYMPLDANDRTGLDFEPITPWTWKWVHLSLQHANGGESAISLRRPNWWFEMVGAAQAGDSIWLSLPEMALEGRARVQSITPNQLDTRLWDQQRNGDYVVLPITGKFQHQANEILQLGFAGSSNVLGVTAAHPFQSNSRNAWVAAGELELGEVVQTRHGADSIVSLERLETRIPVCNIEVYKAHNYFVDELAVLVHNNCNPAWIASKEYKKLGKNHLAVRGKFEKAMKKGIVPPDGQSGIVKFSGKGKNVGGTIYRYELKTNPSSVHGGHRMYGNLAPWTNPNTGVTKQVITFTKHVTQH